MPRTWLFGRLTPLHQRPVIVYRVFTAAGPYRVESTGGGSIGPMFTKELKHGGAQPAIHDQDARRAAGKFAEEDDSRIVKVVLYRTGIASSGPRCASIAEVSKLEDAGLVPDARRARRPIRRIDSRARRRSRSAGRRRRAWPAAGRRGRRPIASR